MTDVAIAPSVVEREEITDDGLCHYYCWYCDPDGDWGLCGEFIADFPETDWPEEEVCQVCEELVEKPCKGCGAIL